MFTSIDKALTALVMATLFLLNQFAGLDLGLSAETVAAVIAAATPVLIYLIPNKAAGG